MNQPTSGMTSDSLSLQAQLTNLSDDQYAALRDVYLIERRKSDLRGYGWINLVLGGLTVWSGTGVFTFFSIPRLIQLVVGLLIVGQSLWALIDQKNARFLGFSLLLLISGIWNIYIGAIANAVLTLLFGVLQLWWTYTTYQLYRHYRQFQFTQPPENMVTLYHNLWNALIRGKLKREENVIEVWIKLLLWRIWLIDNLAVVASKDRRLLIVRRKDELNFIPASKKPMGKWRVNGRMRVNEVYERSVMSGKAFEKYAPWKGLETILAQVGPSTWERLPRAIRIVLRLIGVLILLFVIYVIAGFIDLFIRYG